MPVILGSEPLARLIVKDAHEKDHRKDIGTILADTRRLVWIVKGRKLVREVVRSCMRCRLFNRRTQEQIMGDLPKGIEEVMRPFQHTQLDLMGPFIVKGLGGAARRTFKAWAAVWACTRTKAVSVWALKGYSTGDFLLGYDSFAAIYGEPSLIVTDRGSQLVAAAEVAPDWTTIQHATARRGTAWRFVPAATPWRNGLAERTIGLLKRTLMHQIGAGETLDFAQLGAFLHRAAALLNQRPLSARVFSETEFMALTPRDLLLGRAPSLSVQEALENEGQEVTEAGLARRVSAVELKLELWWKAFYGDVFPLLIPRQSMKVQHPNLQVADIVLLKYCVKFGKDRFRLARVLELREDAHGVVRTVLIGVRNRRAAAREPPGECKAGLTEMEAPVQRLVLVLPAQEQPEEITRSLRERAELRREIPAEAEQPTLRVQVPEVEPAEIVDRLEPPVRRSLRQGRGRRV